MKFGWERLWPPIRNESFVFLHFVHGAGIVNSRSSVRGLIMQLHVKALAKRTSRKSSLESLPKWFIAVVVQELKVEFYLVLLGVHDVLVLWSDVVNHAAVQHSLGDSCNSDRFTYTSEFTLESQNNNYTEWHPCTCLILGLNDTPALTPS